MSNNFAPNVVRDGLVMLLDAANPKSYNPAENLLLYSQSWATSPWANANCNITSSQPAPDGTNTAVLLTCNGTAPTVYYQGTTTATTGTGILTSSVYAKAATSTTFTFNTYYVGDTEINITFTLTGAGSTDTPATSTITAVGNGWYRCTIQTPARVSAATDVAWRVWPTTRPTATAGLGCYFWGAQLNKSIYARTYTLTTAAVVAASTTWTDLTGTGNNVTLANAPSFTGTTFLFNGTDQWCFNATPNLPTNKLNSTCLCWCLPDSTRPADTYVGLVSYGGRTSSNARLMSYWTNTTTAYTSSAYWGNDYVPQATAITLNSWNMVGMLAYGAPTTNNTTLLAGSSPVISYVTGNSSNYTAGLVTTSINLAVASTDYPGRYFKGQIGVVMFYNRALTTDEIQQNYYALRGRFGI
jgi:hypothetical protein